MESNDRKKVASRPVSVIGMAKVTTDVAFNNQLKDTTRPSSSSSVARQATFSQFYDVHEVLGKYVQFCCCVQS